jgi:hypothetical protein
MLFNTRTIIIMICFIVGYFLLTRLPSMLMSNSQSQDEYAQTVFANDSYPSAVLKLKSLATTKDPAAEFWLGMTYGSIAARNEPLAYMLMCKGMQDGYKPPSNIPHDALPGSCSEHVTNEQIINAEHGAVIRQ